MNYTLKSVPIVIFAAQLTACSVIHKSFDIDGERANSLSIDAKQRVILVTKHGGEYHDEKIVCAEPSPDVFVAAAAAGSFGVDAASKTGQITASRAEQAATISRGYTVQMLRDGLYRACEAYMNGALNKQEYKHLLDFYDVVMITLLAIEGVTQPKLFEPTTISSGSPPSAAPAQPGAKPKQPGAKPAQPEAEPSQPDAKPAQHGAAPAEPKANAKAQTEDKDASVARQVKEMLEAYYKAKQILIKLFYQQEQSDAD